MVVPCLPCRFKADSHIASCTEDGLDSVSMDTTFYLNVQVGKFRMISKSCTARSATCFMALLLYNIIQHQGVLQHQDIFRNQTSFGIRESSNI